jgi:ribokinase
MPAKWVTVMGSFVADVAFRTEKLPAWGETYMGKTFQLGPGGKGSNQAVAAVRAGCVLRVDAGRGRPDDGLDC